MKKTHRFDVKLWIIIILIFVILGLVIYYNTNTNEDSKQSKKSSHRIASSSEEDEAIDVVNRWLSAQKSKDLRTLLKVTDAIGTDALAKSFTKQGSYYVIKNFDDNYYDMQQKYKEVSASSNYKTPEKYVEAQLESLYDNITYTNIKIKQLENLEKVSGTSNIYQMDFKAQVTYVLALNENEVSITLKGPLYLMQKDGEFYILGTYDDIIALNSIY